MVVFKWVVTYTACPLGKLTRIANSELFLQVFSQLFYFAPFLRLHSRQSI